MGYYAFKAEELNKHAVVVVVLCFLMMVTDQHLQYGRSEMLFCTANTNMRRSVGTR